MTGVGASWALAVETVSTVALAVAAIALVALIAVGLFVASMTRKVLAMAVLATLGAGVWTQRAAVEDCAERIREAALQPGVDVPMSCSLLGLDVTVDL